ncbi:MAG: histidinol dehydrogenase [bacterium]
MRIVDYVELKKDFYEHEDTFNLYTINRVIDNVRKYGDQAIRRYTRRFDNVVLDDFRIKPAEIKRAYLLTNPHITKAIQQAMSNIRKFSCVQLNQLRNFRLHVSPGVMAEQKIIPINRIGIYVPGGRFPLVSTVLMCGVPAKIAGVREIVLCSPPTYKNTIHPAILASAKIVGISEIYKIGGAQAIAALAYGTETITRVDKIFGPGNIYVTTAKKLVFGDAGIDFVAGPTEILIIADRFAEPDIIAADLLAQAEHDTNAIPILVTNSTVLAESVKKEVKRQLKVLKTKSIAQESLKKNGLIITVKNLNQAIEIANKKAPEHLELQVKNPQRYIGKFKNYGSLFIGRYSAEALGDYSSGLNHTLPTNGSARYTGGLHIKDFLKIQTILKVNKKGLKEIGPIAEQLAHTEGLWGHLNSIRIRRVR